jgi:Glycosyltransferase 61
MQSIANLVKEHHASSKPLKNDVSNRYIASFLLIAATSLILWVVFVIYFLLSCKTSPAETSLSSRASVELSKSQLLQLQESAELVLEQLHRDLVTQKPDNGALTASARNLLSVVESVLSGSNNNKQDESSPLDKAMFDYTQQKCYLQVDESEVCVYDNVLCYDGKNPVSIVEDPTNYGTEIVDYTCSCMDFRYYEPSSLEISGCVYAYAGSRTFNHTAPNRYNTDYSLPITRRRWGPNNRLGMLWFKELFPQEVWGERIGDISEKSNLFHSPSGSFAADILREGPFEHESVPGLTIKRRVHARNKTVDWIDGSLWLVGIDGQFSMNPYHWWTKMGELFDILASNRSSHNDPHPGNGFLQWKDKRLNAIGNKILYSHGAQWDLPSFDNLLFTGDGAVVLESRADLKSWFDSTLSLVTQSHSKAFFNDVLSKYGDGKLLCASTAGIPGVKNKMFNGRSQAWLFRERAYAYSKLYLEKAPKESSKLSASPSPSPFHYIPPTNAHPFHVPRTVTIIDRKGMNNRGIYNKDELVEWLEKVVGLKVRIVPNMASLSFAEQVSLMADTGILIASHGAHMANVMFLPAKSVVIELFPYLMKKNTYRHIASLLDITYLPLFSWEVLPQSRKKDFYGVELFGQEYFYNKCVLTNISSYDALSEHACNAMSKNLPIVIPMQTFERVMHDALTALNRVSPVNPQWM